MKLCRDEASETSPDVGDAETFAYDETKVSGVLTNPPYANILDTLRPFAISELVDGILLIPYLRETLETLVRKISVDVVSNPWKES